MEVNFPPKKGIGLDKVLPGDCPSDLKDLLQKLLAYDPEERISVEFALRHEYFSEFAGQLETPTNK
jgi:serine/threonine protein kinase